LVSRDSIFDANRGPCRHAVRVSVTFVNSVKTNKHMADFFSPSGSHYILVFSTPNVMAIF